MPKYDIEDFIKCCAEQIDDVIPINSVLKDAERFFQLRTKKALLDFIGSNGLEECEFINTKVWEKNPDETTVIYVDAYDFRSMFKLGYIAFMYNNKTHKWLIKSFHLSENSGGIMKDALERANLITGE